MKIDVKSIVLGIAIGFVAGFIIPINLLELSQPSYTKVTVHKGEGAIPIELENGCVHTFNFWGQEF